MPKIARHDAARHHGDALALRLARLRRLGLRAHALDRLSPRQRDFTATAARLLTAGRALTPKQEKWLRDLHAMHKGH